MCVLAKYVADDINGIWNGITVHGKAKNHIHACHLKASDTCDVHKCFLYTQARPGPVGDSLGGGCNKQVFYSSVFPQIARIFHVI